MGGEPAALTGARTWRYGPDMQLTPRYDGPPILSIETSLTDVATPLVRQRRRLQDTVGELDDRQWSAPSRCDGWSVQDVVAHLVVTNQFWTLSIRSALAGSPTQYLAAFDPVATPDGLVDSVRGQAPAETLAAFAASNDALADAVAAVGGDQWSLPGEAPPGHVALRAVALHALWDSWVHERDIVLPLGLDPVEEPDEVAASLQYVAVLSPAFLASTGSTRAGHLAVRAEDPDVAFVVDAGTSARVHEGPVPDGALVLTGRAVDLTEGFSLRTPLVQDVPADRAWLVGGLALVFDAADNFV